MFRRFVAQAAAAGQRRYFGGGAHGHGHHGESYHGFYAPHVANWHKVAGETMMTLTWLWIFYRAKEDLIFVLGIQHPWDAHAHHDDHGHHDAHHADAQGELWVKDELGKSPRLIKKEAEH